MWLTISSHSQQYWDVRWGTLSTAYLGLSLGSKNKVMEVWNGVIERCERSLATWTSQYLSLGGRVVLANSVLDALPTYVMSLLPLRGKG